MSYANSAKAAREKYENSLSPLQRSLREMAAMLNADGYLVVDKDKRLVKIVLYGRPSIHERLLEAILEIVDEQFCWVDPAVYHPVERVYGTYRNEIKHEIIIELRYEAVHSG